jgi:molybdate transport system substrate-binding protein
MKKRQILIFIIGFIFSLGLSLAGSWFHDLETIAQSKTSLIVSAAASLTDALKEIAPLYQQSYPAVTLRYNFGSSGALQQQIENGAPADVFISAAVKQMDALQQKNRLVPNTRRNLLSNRLVLVVPANRSAIGNLKGLADVRVKRIAIGDPRSVPAGQYAQEALTKAGLWNSLKSKYVLANNVRQVLQFVETGNVDAGLVYLTDAKTTDNLKMTYQVPNTMHSPIVYPVAVLTNSRNPTNSRNFLQFLSSDRARKIFEKYGFTPI